MALQHTRLLFGSQTNIERGGSNSATDQYRIRDDAGGGVTRPQAMAYSAAGYPTLGASHPEIPNLFATRVTFASEGRTQVATWAYEPNQGGGVARPPVDILAGDFVSLEISSSTKKVQIPAFQLRQIEVPGDNPVTQFVWDADENQYEIEISVHTFTAVLSGEFPEGLTVPGFFSQFAAIRAQENRLHTFNGQPYLFRPRFIKQRTQTVPPNAPTGQPGEPARWEVQYTWEFDPGVRNTYGPGGTPGVSANGLHFRNPVTINGLPLFTAALVCQDNEYAIRPYQNVRVYPNVADAEQPPLIDFISVYRSDPTGWQTLPGIS
jgi:hypothetical protein